MTYQKLQITEPIEVGYYGTQWLEFMENHHLKLFRRMTKDKTLHAVARSVNEYASDYKALLDRQYEQSYPRPYDSEELRKWRFTRDYYTDSEVMRERVLIPFTKP